MNKLLEEQITERFDEILVNIINYFCNENIIEINKSNDIVFSKAKEKNTLHKKESCILIIQQILINMNIIKSHYKLTRDDIIGIIILIENKLSKESIILYMGYFLNNIKSCETNDKTDEELLDDLNNLIISKFYTNDIEFFKTMLMNQYFLNKKNFCLHLDTDTVDYEFTKIFTYFESMLRELIYIPLKINTEVQIINDKILDDGIKRDDVYKIRKISVDNLLHLNLRDDQLTDEELKQNEHPKYLIEENKPFRCNRIQLDKLLRSKINKKGGRPKSRKRCPDEYYNEPEHSELTFYKIDTKLNRIDERFRDGWKWQQINPPIPSIKKKEKKQTWGDWWWDIKNSNSLELADKVMGVIETGVKNEDRDLSGNIKVFFKNEDMCQRSTVVNGKRMLNPYGSQPKKVITRKQAIVDSQDYLVYNLYKGDSIINLKLKELWYYKSDLLPLKIPINPELNIITRRNIFSFRSLDINNNKILENKSDITNEFIHSGIPILWFYKIYNEYLIDYTDEAVDDFIILYKLFEKNKKIKKLLLNFKRLILFNNKFDEETLVFFIILGSLMYITSNLKKNDNTMTREYYIFDIEFKLNSMIQNILNDKFKYIKFLYKQIPFVLQSEALATHIELTDMIYADEQWRKTVNMLILGSNLINGLSTLININSDLDKYFKTNKEYLEKKKIELENKANELRDTLFFNQPGIEGLRKQQPDLENKLMKFNMIENELKQVKSSLDLVYPKISIIEVSNDTSSRLTNVTTNVTRSVEMDNTLLHMVTDRVVSDVNGTEFNPGSIGPAMISPYNNNTKIVNAFVGKVTVTPEVRNRISQCAGCNFQIFFKFHGEELVEGSHKPSNATYFNHIVVDTEDVPIFGLNQQTGAAAGFPKGKHPQFVNDTLKANSTNLDGLFALVPSIRYRPDPPGVIDSPLGIFLHVMNPNGTIDTITLLNNQQAYDLLRVGVGVIKSAEMVEILKGIRAKLEIPKSQIKYLFFSCEVFNNRTVYQDIPTLVNNTGKFTFVPTMLVWDSANARTDKIVAKNVSKEQFQIGQIIPVTNTFELSSNNSIFFHGNDVNNTKSFEYKMRYGTYTKLLHHIYKRKIVWDQLTFDDQYLAILRVSIDENDTSFLDDINLFISNSPKSLQETLKKVKGFNKDEYKYNLIPLLDKYSPGNWRRLIPQNAGYSKKKLPLYHKGGEPITYESTLDQLYIHFNSKLPVDIKSEYNDDILNNNHINKIINQLIKLKEGDYPIEDKKLFFVYVYKYFDDEFYHIMKNIYTDCFEELKSLNHKIQNIWKKIHEKKIVNKTYNQDLISVFEKFNKEEKIKEPEYEKIIKYTWVKYIFLNDLDIDERNADLLSKINVIDSYQGKSILVSKLETIPEEEEVELLAEKKIFYKDSLLFRLEKYTNHVKTHGIKYIEDITKNYDTYTEYIELYMKYFELINEKLQKLSNDIHRINELIKPIKENIYLVIKKEIDSMTTKDKKHIEPILDLKKFYYIVYFLVEEFFDNKFSSFTSTSNRKNYLNLYIKDTLDEFNKKFQALITFMVEHNIYYELQNFL